MQKGLSRLHPTFSTYILSRLGLSQISDLSVFSDYFRNARNLKISTELKIIIKNVKSLYESVAYFLEKNFTVLRKNYGNFFSKFDFSNCLGTIKNLDFQLRFETELFIAQFEFFSLNG